MDPKAFNEMKTALAANRTQAEKLVISTQQNTADCKKVLKDARAAEKEARLLYEACGGDPSTLPPAEPKPLNIKEQQLLANVLEFASERFGSNGCHDVPESVWEGWTKAEREAFVVKFHEYNGDPEDHIEGFHHIPDFALAGYFADLIKNTIINE